MDLTGIDLCDTVPGMIRLSHTQQAKVIADFQSEDTERVKNAISVFVEHELTIHDIALMARVAGE